MLTLVLASLFHRFRLLLRSVQEKVSWIGAGGPLRWQDRRDYRRRPKTSVPRFRQRTKPAWVLQEIVRLKALMPHAGCRAIADCFNRRHAKPRAMTVGKTYVADTIRGCRTSHRR